MQVLLQYATTIAPSISRLSYLHIDSVILHLHREPDSNLRDLQQGLSTAIGGNLDKGPPTAVAEIADIEPRQQSQELWTAIFDSDCIDCRQGRSTGISGISGIVNSIVKGHCKDGRKLDKDCLNKYVHAHTLLISKCLLDNEQLEGEEIHIPPHFREYYKNLAGFKWGTLPFKRSTYTATHWEPPSPSSIDQLCMLNSTVNSTWPYLHAFLVKHACKIPIFPPALRG
jgi:hypothetical protein